MIQKKVKIFESRNYFPGGQIDFTYFILPVRHGRWVTHLCNPPSPPFEKGVWGDWKVVR
jgi:hypothetical protein